MPEPVDDEGSEDEAVEEDIADGGVADGGNAGGSDNQFGFLVRVNTFVSVTKFDYSILLFAAWPLMF